MTSDPITPPRLQLQRVHLHLEELRRRQAGARQVVHRTAEEVERRAAALGQVATEGHPERATAALGVLRGGCHE